MKSLTINTEPFILTVSQMFYLLFAPELLTLICCIVSECCHVLPHSTKIEVLRILSEGDRGPPPLSEQALQPVYYGLTDCFTVEHKLCCFL